MQVKALAILWAKFPEHYSKRNTIHVDDLSRNFVRLDTARLARARANVVPSGDEPRKWSAREGLQGRYDERSD